MTSNYQSIYVENVKKYGTDIERVGSMFLANLYADQTHFIYEILQNAEDAKAASLRFQLSESALEVTHDGKPFRESDVRGVCGIAESTKDAKQIGRFGIGFKSVYAFTERPEIHSGAESFAVEKFVRPVKENPKPCGKGETLIVLPFSGAKDSRTKKAKKIEGGLRNIGMRSLLFLRNIERVDWSLPNQAAGYCRRENVRADGWVRTVKICEQYAESPDEITEEWRVFSRPVRHDGEVVGDVEIAFQISTDGKSDQRSVKALDKSCLVAFFPTAIETHLGFLVQGPYRTTPARDNVRKDDDWNRHCASETAELLVDALRWLRDNDALSADVLECLPLNRTHFDEGALLKPLFDAVKEALMTEPLLPRFGGGYAAAEKAALARSEKMRELFSPGQLAGVVGSQHEVFWLAGEITKDLTPALHKYLVNELEVKEHTLPSLILKLSKGEEWLKDQPDEWIQEVYESLADLPKQRFDNLPLIRLASGEHVSASHKPKVFLPVAGESFGFLTVRESVCDSPDSKKFLRSLGLTDPDPVDDVIQNILEKKYRDAAGENGAGEYEEDIKRILKAYSTDSTSHREKLVRELRKTAFVLAADASGKKASAFVRADEVYIATEKLKKLFAGVPDVLFVDESHACLCGKKSRDLLKECGADDLLRPVTINAADSDYSEQDLYKIRFEAGLEFKTSHELADKKIRGLDELLELMPRLPNEARQPRAKLLWDALNRVEKKLGSSAFFAKYDWRHGWHTKSKDDVEASFVRKLKSAKWVPLPDGQLQSPASVEFSALDWEESQFLQSLLFKLSPISILAKEAGVDPESIDFLKEKGLTLQDLQNKFGDVAEQKPAGGKTPVGKDSTTPSRHGGESRAYGQQCGGAAHLQVSEGASGKFRDHFHSYVKVSHDKDEHTESSGGGHDARMQLEEKAIAHILDKEPELQRTPAGNHGFDLVEVENGKEVRWVEVKAMSAGWDERPVTVSRKQFAHAQRHSKAFWLYVVEYAGDAQKIAIRKVNDPAGNAENFIFDSGWQGIAE